MKTSDIEQIAEMTNSAVKIMTPYNSSVFYQKVFTTADGDMEVEDVDLPVKRELMIPMHTFSSFIQAIVELRQHFTVECVYTQEPLCFENLELYKERLTCKPQYSFVYWRSSLLHVFYANEANVFLYLSDVDCYVNAKVAPKKATV